MKANLARTGHFSPEDWADFARAVAAPDLEQQMRGHLDGGCQDCTDQLNAWRSVAATAAADTSFEPPAWAQRIARASFAMRQPAKKGPVARAIEATRVLFDSRLVALPAGVRGHGSTCRKVLFMQGDLLVDVQVEPGRQAKPSLLLGQVSFSESHEGARDVHVVIVRDNTVVGKATTNALGEFHVEFEGSAEGLSIAIGLNEKGAVVTLDH